MNQAAHALPADDVAERLSAAAERIVATLDDLLPDGGGPERPLFDAMRYATLNGGKRLRPYLTTIVADLFGAPQARAQRAAAAVEMLHCYSLVHDDLPAMDDDELRRGRPTCHIAFDEATAILAGDALLTLAFDVLADPATHPDAAVRIELVRGLTEAAGAHGMVAGQMIDLAVEHRSVNTATVERLQALKTGALITFSAEAGAILGEAGPAEREAIVTYGRLLGSAFQIVDDLLDEEGDVEAMGKAVGKDAAAGKATLVALLGTAEARKRADRLAADAVASLEAFGQPADPLRDVARFVVTRRT
ncbi:MAG: polyprenyl synthetase family protein [Proteobacteria bacterium]|nr:polyprenyl synthetase family protein [Pseudomonadota bacterium]